jgi:hypothetical protein
MAMKVMRTLIDRVKSRVDNESLRAKRALRAAMSQFHFDDNTDYRNTVLLAGSGRGGTTWIAEIINHDNEYRFIFEPFAAGKVPLARGFRNRQYLRPDAEAPEFFTPARQLLSGAFRNSWTDFYNRRVRSTRRLVKDIRINLFLKWIKTRFPEIPIVLLLRHPCAVVSSRMSLEWDDDLNDFLDQPDLMRDWLEPHRALLAGATESFDRHMLRWCVENSIPLKQFGKDEVHVAYYEQFCEQPAAAVGELFAFLHKPVDGSVFEQLNKPSSQTRKRKSAIMFGERPVASWRKHINADQIARAQELLQTFGLDRVYRADEPMPDIAAGRSLPL